MALDKQRDRQVREREKKREGRRRERETYRHTETVTQGLAWVFDTSKPTPIDTPLTSLHFLILTNSSSTEDQTSKYLSPWGHPYCWGSGVASQTTGTLISARRE